MTAAKYRDPATGQFVTMPVPAHIHANSGRLVGEVVAYVGASAPEGWLICDGSVISEATYPDLYALLGVTYGGAGKLPDLRGKSITGQGGSTPTLGSSAGAATHGHTGSALPTHDHGVSAATTSSVAHSHAVDVPSTTSGSAGAHTHSTGNNNASADVASGSTITVASAFHSHTANSNGSHTHSVNPGSFNSASASHSHTVTPNITPISAGTPVVGSTSSYHPVQVLNYVIYSGA